MTVVHAGRDGEKPIRHRWSQRNYRIQSGFDNPVFLYGDQEMAEQKFLVGDRVSKPESWTLN